MQNADNGFQGYRAVGATLRIGVTEVEASHVFNDLTEAPAGGRSASRYLTGKWSLNDDLLFPIGGLDAKRGQASYRATFYRVSPEEEAERWARWQRQRQAEYLAKNGGLAESELALTKRHEGFHTVELRCDGPDDEYDSPLTWYLTCSVPADVWDSMYRGVLANQCNQVWLAVDFDAILVGKDAHVRIDPSFDDEFFVDPSHPGTLGWLSELNWTTRAVQCAVPPAKDTVDSSVDVVDRGAADSDTLAKETLQLEIRSLQVIVRQSTWLIIVAITIATLLLRR